MHEWERIKSLTSKEKLEKAWRILEEQVWSEMRVFWERKQRNIKREIEENDFRIVQRPYIEQPVNLDRCKYREVLRDLSRRCWENAHRQLRSQGVSRNNSSESRTEAPSIHQVSRSYRAYWPNLDRFTRYRGAGEIAIRKSLGSSIDS